MAADQAGEEQSEAAEEDSITSGGLGSVPWGGSKPFPGRGAAEAGSLEDEANDGDLDEEFSEDDDEDGQFAREMLLLDDEAGVPETKRVTNEAEAEAEAEDAWYADANKEGLFLAAMGRSGAGTGSREHGAGMAGGSPASGEDEDGLHPKLPLCDAMEEQGGRDSASRLQRLAQLLEEAELREAAAAGGCDEAANANDEVDNGDPSEPMQDDEQEDDVDGESTAPEEALQQRLGQQLGAWGEECNGGAADDEDLADPALAASLAAEVEVCVEAEEGLSDEGGNAVEAAAGQGNVGGIPEDGYEALDPSAVLASAASPPVAGATAGSTGVTGSSSPPRIRIPKAKSRPTPEGCEEVALQQEERTLRDDTHPHTNGIQVGAAVSQPSAVASAAPSESVPQRASEEEVRRKYLALLELAAEQKKALNITLFEITELEASLGLVDDAESIATNGFDCQGLSAAHQATPKLRRTPEGRPLAAKAGSPTWPPSAKADAERCAKRRRVIDKMDTTPAANEAAG